MFDPSTPPAAGTKATLPMTFLTAGKRLAQARPRGRIVGKDQPRTVYRDLRLLADGRILVGYRGRYIGSPFGLQLRAGNDLAVQAELPGAAGPFSLRDDGMLLTSGPLWGGYQASLCQVDLGTLAILDTLPLCEPYLWLPGARARLVAQTPSFPSFRDRPTVDPALLEAHPRLRTWVETHERRLLLIEPGDEVSRALGAAEVGPEYAVVEHLALAADGATLYVATPRSVAALSLVDWSLRWRVTLGENEGGRMLALYAMAVSPDGRHLAVGGLAGYQIVDRTLMVLEAGSGKVTPMGSAVGKALGGTSVRSLAWHPSGWLAVGTASGLMAHVDPTGAVRTCKGAGRGIEALLFLEEGRSLLVAGGEDRFRVYPLLDDETGPG